MNDSDNKIVNVSKPVPLQCGGKVHVRALSRSEITRIKSCIKVEMHPGAIDDLLQEMAVRVAIVSVEKPWPSSRINGNPANPKSHDLLGMKIVAQEFYDALTIEDIQEILKIATSEADAEKATLERLKSESLVTDAEKKA